MSDTGHTPGNGATCTGTNLVREPGNHGQNNHAAAAEPKLLLTVEEAAQRLSIGRPKMWQLVMRGEVLSVKIGTSRRVPTTALVDYVRRLTGELVPTAVNYTSHDNIGGSGGQHDEHNVTIGRLNGFSNPSNVARGSCNVACGSFGEGGAPARIEAVRDSADTAERKEGAV